ncbi:hypothetical protein NEF87_003374 [Candidatus Lokiarchaeum ossiferum]|uniref:Carboxypeptidase regulatory-like domain-containing protein n=1 Tax=Candidatus Lokiarchaeum ossiferum TaxID=2951803 RepID=A0ABY6HX02_9ARCH|nr:hypothetical protein NEF87_003374 [Candidatus Lokiarchaeum sp. B-35]
MVSYSQFQTRGRKNAKQISKLSFVLLGLLACSMICQYLTDGNNPNPVNNSQLMGFNPLASTENAAPSEPLAVKEDLSNALGDIEIIDVNVLESLTVTNFVANSNITYIVDNDDQTSFVGTIETASTSNAVGTATDRDANITIQFLTEIVWAYNESIADLEEKVVGFTPVVQPAEISVLKVDGIEITNESLFYTETNLGKKTFFYNFENEYLNDPSDSIRIRYNYNVKVPVSQWKVVTTRVETEEGEILAGAPQYMTNLSTTFTQVYDYYVKIGGSSNLPIRALTNINLPNKNEIFDVSVESYNELNKTDFSYDTNLLNEKIIQIDDYLNISSGVSIEGRFYANFTVEFLEVVDGFWCEDRLVSGTDRRERDYKITITEGPADLMLVYFGFNDTSIYYSHLWGDPDLRSALGRDVSVENVNRSAYLTPSERLGKVFIDGISMLAQSQLTPYLLFKGEIDVITVGYIGVYDLKLTVTDRIQTPLANVQVNIYINDIPYGTLMSNFENYPIAPKTTDSQGHILIRNVPISDFTIEILDAEGNSQENLTANSLKDYNKNLVITSKSHFPAIILYFGGISAVMVVIGFLKFKKY